MHLLAYITLWHLNPDILTKYLLIQSNNLRPYRFVKQEQID